MFEVVVQSEKVIFPNGMVWNLICYELVIELQEQIGYKLFLYMSPSTRFYTPVLTFSQKMAKWGLTPLMATPLGRLELKESYIADMGRV